MKRLLFIYCVLVPVFAMGQNQVKITAKGGRSFCGFNVKNGFYSRSQPKQYITHEAVPGDESGIRDVIDEIKRVLDIDVPIKVYIAAEEDNCFASTGEGGIRIIVADHQFLNRVNKGANTKWAAISILAHEVGHHIAGFQRRATSIESELDADYWSGYVLQKLGAGKEASVKCIMKYGTATDTNSHPGKYSRASTIMQGWEDAVNGNYDADRCEACEN